MKKFLSVFAGVALMAAGLVSCNKDDRSAPSKEEPFKINITGVTAFNAEVEIVPQDMEATYYWDLMEAKEYAGYKDARE